MNHVPVSGARVALLLAALLWWAAGAAGAVWAEVRNPDGVAVIIGNRAYEHQRVPEVSYAHRDAAAFKHYVIDVLGFDQGNLIELYDAGQAELVSTFGNRDNHRGRLWSFLDPAGNSDVVVFYSGHGVPGLKDRRGYLLPTDADPDTAELNGYPIDLLYRNLARLEDARSIAVYLDACFSGESHNGFLIRVASPVAVPASLPSGAKVTVLTAASGTEVASWDEVAEHGLFTTHLLDALYGAADADGDRRIIAGEVQAYLNRHMTRAARRLFVREQHASLIGLPGAVLRGALAVIPQRPPLSPGGAVPSTKPTDADLQRDMYLIGIRDAHQAGEYARVLELVAKLNELGGQFPAEGWYFEGLAYAALRRHADAMQALTRYAERIGAQGERYQDVLRRVLKLEQIIDREDAVYEETLTTSTAAAFTTYLEQYPSGKYAAKARELHAAALAQEAAARRRQADDTAFARARTANTVAAYGEYLKSYPDGSHVDEARRLRETAAARERRRQPGQVFRDCPECPELVVVPAGSYLMGSPASEAGRVGNEGPRHRVTIREPFAVGSYEVTFAEWDACVRAGGCGGYRPADAGWGRGTRPVINVTWEDAGRYVAWLSRRTGEQYRLPSESEWEYAARAGTTTPFHFGSTISTTQANYDGDYTYGTGRKGTDRKRTVTVGSFAANAFGLHDVHGNVWEWTQDCWNGSYEGAPGSGSAWERGECSRRVVRGGSWYYEPEFLRSADRYWSAAGLRDLNLGFRVARTLTS